MFHLHVVETLITEIRATRLRTKSQKILYTANAAAFENLNFQGELDELQTCIYSLCKKSRSWITCVSCSWVNRLCRDDEISKYGQIIETQIAKLRQKKYNLR